MLATNTESLLCTIIQKAHYCADYRVFIPAWCGVKDVSTSIFGNVTDVSQSEANEVMVNNRMFLLKFIKVIYRFLTNAKV